MKGSATAKLLLLDDAGTLLLAEPARDGFRELARAKVCRGTFVNPALADGLLYVRDDQEVICLRLPPPPAPETKGKG